MRESVKSIKAWQHADRLVVEIYRATRAFPKAELYGLTSQMRRAAVSVPANIAEGSQRYTLKDYRQFLYTAMASLAEVEYYIHLTQLDFGQIGEHRLPKSDVQSPRRRN